MYALIHILGILMSGENTADRQFMQEYLNENEYAGAWQMLYAAALTYVAGVCATLASMLRILFMILSSSNRDSN